MELQSLNSPPPRRRVRSVAQQITSLERRARWLLRFGWLALVAGLIFFSYVSANYWAHSWSTALALLATLGPVTASHLYSFLVLDGRVYRLAQTRREQVEVTVQRPLLNRLQQ